MRQRGWVGLVVILLALVVVALLAKDALKQYGLAPGAAVGKAGTPAERARAPGAVDAPVGDLGTAASAPAAALERSRGVEDMVKRAADERASRGDGAVK